MARSLCLTRELKKYNRGMPVFDMDAGEYELCRCRLTASPCSVSLPAGALRGERGSGSTPWKKMGGHNRTTPLRLTHLLAA
jgi:hypothetical protein